MIRLARTLAAVGLLVAGTWTLAVGVLWAGESRWVFMTTLSHEHGRAFEFVAPHTHVIPAPGGSALESLTLAHDDQSARYWILFCPPAGASIHMGRIQRHLETLWSFGYNVVAFDYRGFGDTPGTPSEDGLYADARTVYDDLTARGVPASRIIIAGRSLGSAVAVDLASHEPSAGLLLFSAIDSVPSAAARLYPWAPVRQLARYRFDSLSKAARITVPTVLVQGTVDPYMPAASSRTLFTAFRGPKLMIETGGGHHHSGFVHPTELYETLDHFWAASALRATTTQARLTF